MIPAQRPARGTAELETIITAAAARQVGAGGGTIRLDTPFELLGLDSLAMLELAAHLEEQTGSTLPEGLLYECTDLGSLARSVRRIQAQQAREEPLHTMLSDAVLPAEITPQRQVTHSTDLQRAGAVLLTGATGFLGSALARELLQKTPVRLICLVRAHRGTSARDRLRRRLLAVGIQPGVVDRRVRAVEADLERPSLAVTRSGLRRLAADADAVCHVAADVNWILPYAALRRSNVLGTRELLRLACNRGLPFHFVSSVSVCYSTAARCDADETFNGLPYLAGVHLGYAQSKIVAEALVREAGSRGLPVRIHRPSLISGDSETGAYNSDDLMTALIRGCIHMGIAPDLDWCLDSLPVDRVAAAVVALSAGDGPVFHLRHPRPRHWRECVLWMRLYGYPVRLVSYHAWLRQLELETQSDCPAAVSHPLRALRPFFLRHPPGERGLTLPELYEEGRRPRLRHAYTSELLGTLNWSCPPLDGALLDTYFTALRRQGDVPAPPHPIGAPRERGRLRTSDSSSFVPGIAGERPPPAFFSELTGLPVTRVARLDHGSDHSIIAELAGWRSDRVTGLFRFRLHLDDGSARNIVLKVKPQDQDVLAAGEALARVCDPHLGDLYAAWRDRLGIGGAQDRELAIYQQTDPRFVRHAPRLLGTFTDSSSDLRVLALEYIDDASVMDASDGLHVWTQAVVGVAIDGLAALQAIWYGREPELRAQPWMGHVQSARSMGEMRAFWGTLAQHAEPAFSVWAGADMGILQRRLIDRVEEWWRALDVAPRTLIHGDFNPRNICIRGKGRRARVCAYDWELATMGVPQRDLAELLCFVLPPEVSRQQVERLIWRHRDAVGRKTGVRVDRGAWIEGVRGSLNDLLINRLAIYALVHRVRRQPFLPRVVRTWRTLYEIASRMPARRARGGGGEL